MTGIEASPSNGARRRACVEDPTAYVLGRDVDLEWAYRLVDALVFFGASFTILQNVNYLVGGSLFAEVALFPPLAVLVYWMLRRLRAPEAPSQREPSSRAPWWALSGSLAVLALADPAHLDDTWVRSLVPAGFALLAATLLALRWRPSTYGLRANNTSSEVWSTRKRLPGRLFVPAVMILGAGVSLFVHRPDADDAAYIGWAAHLTAQPFEMLPRTYPFIGEGVPLPYPPFPLMAYLDAIAAASWLTGTEPMWITGVVVAPLGGAAIVLAYAVAAHTLAGRRWAWIWLVAVAWLLTDGSAHKALADFAFIRIWQGKCLFLHVLLPLVLSATLRFVSAPSVLSGLRVAGLGVCAVGVSPIAIWMVPPAIGVGLMAGAIATKGRWKLIGLTPVLAIHPLVVGLLSLIAARTTSHVPAVPHGPLPPPLRLHTLPFRDVLGTGDNLKWMLGALAISGLFGATRRLRAVAAVSTLTVMVCFANPAVVDLVARYVTTPSVYWRVMWLLPIPILLGAMVESITRVGWPRFRRTGAILAGAFAVWLLGALPTVSALSKANKVVFAAPGPQAPPQAWAMAEHLREVLPRDSDVVAAEPVAWVLPTMLRTPRAYLPRQNMASLIHKASWGNRRIESIRSYALAYASGRVVLQQRIIRAIASEPSVRAFVTVPRPPRLGQLTRILRAQGFVGPERRSGWLLYLRKSTAPPPRNRR